MIYLLIWIQLQWLGADVVSTSQDAQNPATDVVENKSCGDYEEDFRKFILLQINQSLNTFRHTANCFNSTNSSCSKIRNESLLILKKYRKDLSQLYETMVYDHIKKRPFPDLARQCLLNRVGVPEFTNNIRDVKLQIDDPTLCVGEKESFQQELDTKAEDYLSGKIPSRIPPETLIAIKTFQQSPIAKQVSDYAKYEREVSDQDLLKELSTALFQLSARIEKLRDKIANLSSTDLYKLYEFNAQSQIFSSNLPTEESKAFEKCKSSSHFVLNCTLNLEFSRCGSKIWGFTKDLLPILPIIDGLRGLSTTRAAQDSGVMTSEEATSATVDNTIKALFGFSGLTSIVRGTAVKLGRSVPNKLLRLDTKMLSESEKMVLLARNAQLDDLSRMAEISRVTGRSYSPYETAEILRSHKIGSGYFNYTSADYRKKIEILENIGMSKDEIDELMRRGLIGGHRNSEFIKIESSFSSTGLKVDPNHIQKSFTEKAAKKATENIRNGQIRKMKGSDCYVVETLGQMRVILSSDKSTVLFAGSHEAYNNFYTTSHFAGLCR